MENRSPPDAGFRLPAEWEGHAACWMAWPHRAGDWADELEPARAEIAAIARAVAGPGGEPVELLIPPGQEDDVRARLGTGARLRPMQYGDSWTRDTGPFWMVDEAGGLGAVCFAFNGWGGKYPMPGDEDLAERMAGETAHRVWSRSEIIEGGAIDVDGRGSVLTTRDCLLNGNRHPRARAYDLERALAEGLGLERVVWLDAMLANDHTDGHVDTLARFVAEGTVVCMEPGSSDDPNRDVLVALRRQLEGAGLEVVTLPSPGRVEGPGGEVLPASYCNFYLANGAVVLPTYGSRQDEAALEAVEELFPGRRAVGVPSRHVLTGGGAVHCVTRQQPAAGGSSAATPCCHP